MLFILAACGNQNGGSRASVPFLQWEFDQDFSEEKQKWEKS